MLIRKTNYFNPKKLFLLIKNEKLLPPAFDFHQMMFNYGHNASKNEILDFYGIRACVLAAVTED